MQTNCKNNKQIKSTAALYIYIWFLQLSKMKIKLLIYYVSMKEKTLQNVYSDSPN